MGLPPKYSIFNIQINETGTELTVPVLRALWWHSQREIAPGTFSP